MVVDLTCYESLGCTLLFAFHAEARKALLFKDAEPRLDPHF